MPDFELEIARHLLEGWADWLMRDGGYAHQSSIEAFQQGGMGCGIFRSQIPQDVEASKTVVIVSRTLQHMQALDSEAVALLYRLYLRDKKQRVLDVAALFDLGVSQFQFHRRQAERKFLDLFRVLDAQTDSVG